ncbi:MAG: cupin domain-containing protein [Hyphomicrobiales bacterium]|nr:cupin domain-containing protein [Hyphomicrobiales bacterium]
MSTAATPTAGSDPPYEDIRNAWRAANLSPLWESPVAHKSREGGPAPTHWRWRQIRPLIEQAMTVASPAAIERRVLTFTDPTAGGGPGSTTTNLTAALQILLPGEKARPHRHTMNALRFVIEGSGASTLVDGKDCPMDQGDLVITPGWTWHEHVHRGGAPIIWLDALDAPLHRYLGTDRFEPGPIHDLPQRPSDSAFAVSNIVPELGDGATAFSPVFRYPWKDARAAVRAAPTWKDGSRRVRYVNPLTGGSTMPLMDCHLVQIDQGTETVRFRTTSNAVCLVCEGRGQSRVGEDTLRWERNDVFSLPHGNWIIHKADEMATLFLVTDRDALRRLDLLNEQFGNEF